MTTPNDILHALLAAAVDAAHPSRVLPRHLASLEARPKVVIGAGKAAGAMAQALEETWPEPIEGLVVVPHGYTVRCRNIEVVEAAHPVPDEAGLDVSRRMLAMVAGLGEDEHVVMLLSGGGSALLGLPAGGLHLADKKRLNRSLLRSGATVAEMNCVRKHVSAIKGGRLAEASWPATMHTFAISDVPGDDPSLVASGPTVPDPTTSQDALTIIERYRIDASEAVLAWLRDARSETPKPSDQRLSRSRFTMIATPQVSLDAAAAVARQCGYTPIILGDLEGESREVAKVHAAIARQIRKHAQPVKAPCVILSGGETTVTLRGNGRGGRNTEFLLSLTNELRGESDMWAVAADTDGIDGSERNAGAIMTPATYGQAIASSLNPTTYLDNNDGYGFFEQLGSLIVTGPTHTNVNDFRAIIIK